MHKDELWLRFYIAAATGSYREAGLNSSMSFEAIAASAAGIADTMAEQWESHKDGNVKKSK